MNKVMSIIKHHWILVLFGIVVGFIGWWKIHPNPPTYTEYKVIRKDLVDTLDLSGKLSAKKIAYLKFQSSGQVAWIGVAKGDIVKKWQTIANLDRRLLQKQLEKELNDYMTTRWNYEDTRSSYNITGDDIDSYHLSDAAKRILERSQFTLNNSVLDVEIQSVTNELSVLTVPFDGIIADLPISNSGVNVLPTDTIATIIDPSTLYFSAEVDELDIGKISVGKPVKLIFDAFQDEEIESSISAVSFTPITLSGGGTGYTVEIALPIQNSDLKYKLGMNGDANVILSERNNAVVLPIEAVTEKDDKKYVLIKVDKKVIEHVIQTGIQTENDIEIVSGLSDGSVVYTSENVKN
jgi:HlyD family secretion protein